MKIFNNFKLGVRILAGFFIVAIIAGVIGIIGVNDINTIDTDDKKLYEKMTVPMSNLYKMTEDFQKIRVEVRDIVISSNSRDISDYETKYKASKDDFDGNLAIFEKTLLTADGKSVSDRLSKSFADYNQIATQIIELAKGNKDEQAIELLRGDAVLKANTMVEENMASLSKIKVDLAKTTSEDNGNTAKSATNLMIAFIIVGVLLAIALGILISKSITKPIKKLLEAADKISQGDLNAEVDTSPKNEVGDLARSFEKMITAIKLLTSDINTLSDSAVEGKLDIRADVSKHAGDYRKIVEGVNNTLDAITEPIDESRKVLSKMALNDLTLVMTGSYKGTMKDFAEDINSVHARVTAVVKLLIEISVGNTSGLEGLMKVGKRSENDKLMPSMIVMMTAIQNLIKETSMLAGSAVEGNLQARGDISKFQGGYREVLEGFNRALDAVIEPVKEASAVLQEMANGNLKVHVKGDYKGDHADIKNALNGTIDSLSSYVTEISQVLDEMSNSNLDLSINNEYKGDFSKIKDALNLIVQSFNEVFTEINNSADQVSSGSNQVSEGSQALSQGTTEQASAIEELTASIVEVAAQTKQNAVNASQANELALNAKEGAVLGNVHMKEMLKSMEEINESSSNISKIIKVIDDIAFQTNILALNAAVEAARAGQHGKGFAVVAEEVRNLAARSANAAKETTDLIEGSIKKVEFGTKIANNTAESLDKIVLEVSKAATLVGEIASASNEQATAISQINRGIEQVSDVVQTNSSTAEESAAASEELSGQASMLKNMVEKFKLKRGRNNVVYNEVAIGTQRNSRNVKNKPSILLGDREFGKY